MKKYLLLIIAAALLLSGCGMKGGPAAPAETPQVQEITPEPTPDPYIEVISENNDYGYLLKDIDGDGTEELLFATRTGNISEDQIIRAMYSKDGGEAYEVFRSDERSCYYLCADGTIVNEVNNSVYSWSVTDYEFSGGSLVQRHSVVMDMTSDRYNPYSVDGETREENEAIGTANSYKEQYIKILPD